MTKDKSCRINSVTIVLVQSVVHSGGRVGRMEREGGFFFNVGEVLNTSLKGCNRISNNQLVINT